VARLTRLDPPKRKLKFGVLKGKVKVAEDFDVALPDDVIAMEPLRLVTADKVLSAYGGAIEVI